MEKIFVIPAETTLFSQLGKKFEEDEEEADEEEPTEGDNPEDDKDDNDSWDEEGF